ncbi:glycosyltransferase family protein [Vagococcus fluvialis]|uniref:hypothetical protein n=1 Tax=Vagococcus fluvialis TaxID=2738 RepID=UPI001D0A8C41|nr:hypothetical protein [Vagococcus fluvialis]UDM78971.1 hypothetical protein K5K97_09640 [Vagococcus fluvialis]
MKYITKYSDLNNKQNREYTLSTLNLDKYIIKKFEELHIKLEVVSANYTTNNNVYYKKKIEKRNDNTTITLLPTFGLSNKSSLIFSKLYLEINLFMYLLFNVKKKEKIMIRHSLIYMIPLFIASKIKGFQYVLNFGEEYGKVTSVNPIYRKLEPIIIKSASNYIFSNDILASIYEVEDYEWIKLYGVYDIESSKDSKQLEDKYKIVYAGIITIEEGSAYKAINIASFLNKDYEIHIMGKVLENEKQIFLDRIKKSNDINECKIYFHGEKKANDFNELMYNFDLGLNFRKIDEVYIDYAFPSKLLTYLSFGLEILSTRINVVVNSDVGKCINYVDNLDEEHISNEILRISNSDCKDNKNILIRLDKEFKNSIDKSLGIKGSWLKNGNV